MRTPVEREIERDTSSASKPTWGKEGEGRLQDGLVTAASPTVRDQLTVPDKAKRDEMFRQMDNGNGALSLAEIDKVIATDDPFLTTFAFPCGPWNPLTQFNMARSEETAASLSIGSGTSL